MPHTRYAINDEAPILETLQDVRKKIAEHHLVAIIFNTRYVGANSMELIFNKVRVEYERDFNIYAFKCVLPGEDDEYETDPEFLIEVEPTLLFFLGGKKVGRLDGPGALNLNSSMEKNGSIELELRKYFDRWLENEPRSM